MIRSEQALETLLTQVGAKLQIVTNLGMITLTATDTFRGN